MRQGAGEKVSWRIAPALRPLLWAVAALAAIAAQAQGPAAGTKIGYVDMQRLLDNAPQMAASKSKLEREFTARDAAIKADEAKLAQLKQRYDRDGAIMSKADAEALKREIDALDRANKRARDEARNDLNTRAAAERDRVWQQIQDVVIEYARSQNYDLLVPSPAIYFNPRIDVTDALIERLKRAPAGETAKP